MPQIWTIPYALVLSGGLEFKVVEEIMRFWSQLITFGRDENALCGPFWLCIFGDTYLHFTFVEGLVLAVIFSFCVF